MDIVNMMASRRVQQDQTNGDHKSENNINKTKSGDNSSSTDLKNGVAVDFVHRILPPQWKIHGSHMVTRLPSFAALKAYYEEGKSVNKDVEHDGEQPLKIKVAAFDMDDTLITTKSGIKFGRGPHDWKWRNEQIIPTLQEKVKGETRVFVIFTNQSSVSVTSSTAAQSKSYRNLCTKAGLMTASIERNLGTFPVLFFASTGKPRKGLHPRSSDEAHFSHRKPESGMWSELERYFKRCFGESCEVDLEDSYFVGDAAGRDGDHSAADLGFASNAGVKFMLPEDYFGQ